MTYFHYYATTSRNLDRVVQYGLYPLSHALGLVFFRNAGENRLRLAADFARVVSTLGYSGLTATFFGLESELIDANARSVGVRGCIDNRQMQLRPGMFARVNAVFGERVDALVIPEEAIVPQGGRSFVVRVVPGANKDELVSERVTVKIGLRQPGKVEILDGLSEGDAVVVAGQQRLQKDGTLVRIVDMSKAQAGANNSAPGAPGAPTPGAQGGASATVEKAAPSQGKGKAPVSAGDNPCLRGLNAAR